MFTVHICALNHSPVHENVQLHSIINVNLRNPRKGKVIRKEEKHKVGQRLVFSDTFSNLNVYKVVDLSPDLFLLELYISPVFIHFSSQ
jgi:hypothetical protein